ncbi:ATP-binding protein [Methylocapsa palsarum]|uniref:histidine kinase n=1 Tax=Methylocapsa palsarum TaxID=1612308 RepID=A0A1I3WZ60_9HYPH|nr:ATP-binding protein [Methylocapsa palsarum]SFK12654.1 Signal transduction histidine kinase [Methylocapsa palsarum]
MESIARRLFYSAAVLSFTILLAAGLVLSAIYRRTAEASFDQRLGVYLRALVADIATPGEGGREGADELSDPQFELALSGWYWQVTRLDGDKPRVRGSRSLFAARLPRLANQGVPAGLGGARRGYVKGPDDRPLRMLERVIDAGDQGLYLVQVAAKSDELDAQISRFEFDLVVTFALLAIALLGSSALQLRYGLRPLRRLQEGVASIRRGDAEKIDGDFPQDIAPLAGEINLLIAANRTVAERARTQVGNLAHALKTPLSVIVNEASADAGALAGKVEEQAQVMRDQITYYLDRARVAVRAGAVTGSTDVGPVIDGLVRTFQKIYRERGVNFSAAAQEAVRFLGERQDLEEMIGNLVDNAGKWAASEVSVSVEPEAPRSAAERAYLRIVIDDDGPGLAAEQRESALRRGLRLDETKPGSGLGLSIVVDLAGLYGGALALDESPTGGMRATLRLPAASNSVAATAS